MAKRKKPTQLAPWASSLIGDFAWRSLGPNPLDEMGLFAAASSEWELGRCMSEAVLPEVELILELASPFDAFDLIELIRLREMPVAPVLALGGQHDGTGAVIELISLILAARGNRTARSVFEERAGAHEIIEELHDRARRLIRLSTYRSLFQTRLRDQTALARLAAEYQTHWISVRSMQYASIRDAHDAALFDRPEIDKHLTAELGFSYREFAAVRLAIQDHYSGRMTQLRDTTSEIVLRHMETGAEPSSEEIEVFRSGMSDLMFLPGKRASFTARELADQTGLDLTLVDRVLEPFTLRFDSLPDPAKVALDFLRGVNPLARNCLVCDEVGNYIMTSQQIGADSFRYIAEDALKPKPKAWKRYDTTRRTVSEALAVQAIERLLQTPATYTGLKYLTWTPDAPVEALNANCADPVQVGKQTETDALFIIDDVALCLEVKGRSIADPARRGDLARLRTEVDEILGVGAEQASRVESLVKTNRGLWMESGKWLDLSHVREVRSIVVGLDVLGPLSVALGDLRAAGVLEAGSVPWLASLHDLEVLSKVIDHPGEFLLYLRRRTDSGVATFYRGCDELDLFMLFLEGGLYVEPDPDKVYEDYPQTGQPKPGVRNRYRRDARPTYVGTHTDPLDAWIYWEEGSSPDEIAKPRFNMYPGLEPIIEYLTQKRPAGWLRFSADLLSLAGSAQKKVCQGIRKMTSQHAVDGKHHSMAVGFAGVWGYPMIFGYVKGVDQPAPEEHLRTYMTAKKHQMGSDRSLGLLYDREARIVGSIYLNDPPREDPELDALGVGLVSVADSRKPIPPSARRSTRRLRGSRRKR